MTNQTIRRKYGMVIILDALGASNYSDHQIKDFLSTRKDINNHIKYLSGKTATKALGDIGVFHTPEIFTFGDTVIITIPLQSKKHIIKHLWIISFLMRRYLYHSMCKNILFRGSFSIGNYISDPDNNTVMGEAVSDAASWYEESEWMGLSSTPKTNTTLEYIFISQKTSTPYNSFKDNSFGYYKKYNVPMKNQKFHELITINWPSAFFDEGLLEDSDNDAETNFLESLQKLSVPKGTEIKYENIKNYFNDMKEK